MGLKHLFQRRKNNPGIARAGQQIKQVYDSDAKLPTPQIFITDDLPSLLENEQYIAPNKNRIHLDQNPNATHNRKQI
jgi:hypothetical protein